MAEAAFGMIALDPWAGHKASGCTAQIVDNPRPRPCLRAADAPNADTKKGQVCEANFYSAQLALQQGAKMEATLLFRLAAADCPKDFVELPAANTELKALGESH
jgi:hypothetical protein